MVPLTVGAILLVVVATWWTYLDQKREETLHTLVQSAAELNSSFIQTDIRTRIPALYRIVGRWESRGGLPKAEFLDDAQNFILDLPGFQAIEWVDKNYIVRWVEPLKGNERALGLDLAFEEKRRVAFEQARDGQTPIMSSPIDLVQGAKGVLVYIPIFVKNKFDGFLLAVLNTERWIDYALKFNDQAGLFTSTVRIDDEFVYGNKSGTSNLNLHWRETVQSNNMNHTFVVETTPTEEFFVANRTDIPEWSAAGGVGLSLMIAYMVFLFQRASFVADFSTHANIALEREIQERKRFEKELADKVSELDFQKSALDEHAIVSIADTQGNITYVNKKFCNISGYTRDQLMGQNHRILNSGFHPNVFFDNMWKTISSGKVWRGNIRNLRKGGGYYWVDATIVPFLNDAGKPFQYVAIRTDITEQKETEEELRKVQRRFEQSQSFANIGTWDWNIQTGDLHWSDQISVLFGGAEGSLSTSYDNFVGAIHPDDRTAVTDAVTACVERNAEYNIEHRVVWQDGTVRWLHESGDVVRDDAGVALHMLGVVMDVTNRKAAEEGMRLAKEEADQANSAKSDFLSSMSHELRTPMNAILGFGQMLEYNPKEPLTGAQKESVDHIMKGGQHLLELINDVLDLAKIESGKTDLSIEDISISEILDECLSLITPMADARGIKIIVEDGVSKSGHIRADHTRFKQSLLNLMSNAVKYNREKGSITIDCKPTLDDMLHISVTDTGEGISSDDFEDLFAPFNRLSAENSDIEGTGIGLTITKQLIERMNGHIGVRSEVGKGSTFWIKLPLAEEKHFDTVASGPKALDQVVKQLPDISGTVLYVEDNPANLQLMELIIDRVDGLSMISAHNAELGIELAKSKKPNLIILDINLPGMDGFQALKRLTALEEIKNTPIIALSANATSKDIEKGIKAGFRKYLTKPILVEEVVDTIKELLEA
ncbi:MAG: PAS domain-containing protein [Rhodospirillaceae bacterium]|nr:PAS domain-containing protein [Rhodospirillaceae bacterium]